VSYSDKLGLHMKGRLKLKQELFSVPVRLDCPLALSIARRVLNRPNLNFVPEKKKGQTSPTPSGLTVLQEGLGPS